MILLQSDLILLKKQHQEMRDLQYQTTESPSEQTC